ncbi:MAG TPA: hypothetical protein PKE07_13950 [Lacibacter sp.]|nr:hypothetical protein [Lacibacter sp.]HMO88638.1 hypothetical protein [Lacibacter sp.]
MNRTKNIVLHNPYTLVTVPVMQALLRQPVWLVRQHYPRGLVTGDAPGTHSLLLTYYDGTNHLDIHRSRFHYEQLHHDRYGFRYDGSNQLHRDRLLLAAQQLPGYKVYINLLNGPWLPPATLRQQLHQYLQQELPAWQYTPQQPLQVRLLDRYGKLFLHLRWKGHQTEVPLEAVETVRPCATI